MRPRAIDTGDLAQIEAGRRVVVEYLEEARALERSLVTNLKAHIAITPPGDYRSRLERHLDETRAHAGSLGQRLDALSAHASLMAVGVGIAQTIAGQAFVMAKGPIDLVRGATGEERLLKNAKDEAASETLEIATYDALEEAAKAVGDEETARLAAANRRDEEKMLSDLRKLLPELTRAAVAARTIGESSWRSARAHPRPPPPGRSARAHPTARRRQTERSRSRSSATRRSQGVVTLRFSAPDATTRTRPPARSTSQASSVA